MAIEECPDIQFEIYRCPNADNHENYRLTSWCEPLGTANSHCPECGMHGIDAQLRGRYGSTNPTRPWAPYRQLYQTRP